MPLIQRFYVDKTCRRIAADFCIPLRLVAERPRWACNNLRDRLQQRLEIEAVHYDHRCKCCENRPRYPAVTLPPKLKWRQSRDYRDSK